MIRERFKLKCVIPRHCTHRPPFPHLTLSFLVKRKIPWSTFGFLLFALAQCPSSCTWPWLSLDGGFWMTAAGIGQESLAMHTGLKWSSFWTVSQFSLSEWHTACMCVSWVCLVVCVAAAPSPRVGGEGVCWSCVVTWGSLKRVLSAHRQTLADRQFRPLYLINTWSLPALCKY